MDTLTRPRSFEAVASRQAQYWITKELRHFEANVRQAELTMQLALSALLIAAGCDTPTKREIALERIRDDLVTLVGDQWADIRSRLDDAGSGDVVELRFPTCEPKE